jgi:hypothetical protein
MSENGVVSMQQIRAGRRARMVAAGALAGGLVVAAIPMVAAPAQAATKYTICYFDQTKTADQRTCLKQSFSTKSSTMLYFQCWKLQPSPKTHLRRGDGAGGWKRVSTTVTVERSDKCSKKFPWMTQAEVTVKRNPPGAVTQYMFVLPTWAKAQKSTWSWSVCVLPKGDAGACGVTPTPEPTPTPTPTESAPAS